jgi:LGFP repeat
VTATADALHALGRTSDASVAQRAADAVTGWLSRRTSRRGFLVRAGVVGSALAVDTVGFVLKPQSAYAAVCGPGASCSSGWTVFCATINNGVNACPPGSIAAGWWKADGASLCGGKARYIVDCNATCSRCGGSGSGICARSCWSCSCRCGPSGTCDQRKTCCNAFRYGQCHQEVPQVGGVMCRVVSCTPPWKWEECSTAPATDNNTRNHSSAQLPSAYTSITKRYIALGENGSRLGNTVYGEVSVPGGRAQRYERGRISASTATGAHETVGPIATRYVSTGAEGGPLGFPVTGTVTSRDGRGLANRFQHGRISHHPDLGTFVLRGAIATRYASASGEDGPLGFPLSDSAATSDGRGAFARFQHGRASQLGAGEVFLTHDDIAAAYERAEAENGPMGFPVSAEVAVAGGRAQSFERGRISAGPTTGAHWLSRVIASKYVEIGAETSALGFPVSDETDARAMPWKSGANPELRTVVFEHGTITHEVFTGRVVVQQTP